MKEPTFEIGANGIDAAKLVEEIRASVSKKMEQGAYSDERLARADRTNLASLAKGDSELLGFYLGTLGSAALVDIDDFEIRERRTAFRSLLVPLKRLIWKMLRFYTYRLWSQQNQVNSLLLAAIEACDDQYRAKIRDIEDRVRQLERSAGQQGPDPG